MFKLEVDTREAEDMLFGVEQRAADVSGAGRNVFAVLEAAEKARFETFHGFDVATGASRAALTSRSGADALREAHGDSFEFGSRVAYDVYHPEMLADLDPAVPERVARAVIAYVVGDAK